MEPWTQVFDTDKWWRLMPLSNREFGISVATAKELAFDAPAGTQWRIVIEPDWRIFLTDVCSPAGAWLNGERLEQGVPREIVVFEDDVWLAGPRAVSLSITPRQSPEGIVRRIGFELHSPQSYFQARAYQEFLGLRSVDDHPAGALIAARDELRTFLERQMLASLGGRAPNDADWAEARQGLRQQFLGDDE